MEQWKKKLMEQREKLSLGEAVTSIRHKCFEGEVTVPKTELWMVLISCFLMGLLYGLKRASKAHGFMIGCNNGNSFGCCRDRKGAAKAGEAEEEDPNNGNEACGGKKSDRKHKCHKKSRCCGRNR